MAEKNKVAVITGASRGIGKAIAERLAEEDCEILLVAKTSETLAKVALPTTTTRCERLATDLRTVEGCERVKAEIDAKFGGRVDILVNNAGDTKGGTFLETPDELWEAGFSLKLFGAVRVTRALWPALRESKGCVVNVIGGFARTPDPDFMIGGAVNAAFANFSKALAGLGLRDDVNVNAVHPGLTVTERLEEILQGKADREGVSFDQAKAQFQGNARRLGEPSDVAELVAFLCSPKARHVHGTAIAVDGGYTAGVY